MDAQIQSNGLTHHRYAQNGTLDYRGRPADKHKTGSWTASVPLLVVKGATTVLVFGVISNLVTYLTHVLHQGVTKSAKDTNNWIGFRLVIAVLGGFASDAYWGRYRTMVYCFVVQCLALVSLTISTSVKSLRPPPCAANDYTCEPATPAQSAFFFVSLYALGLASGCMGPIVIAFGADQFDEADEHERQQKISFFNYTMISIHLGGFVSIIGLVYIEDRVGWSWAFGLLLILTIVAMICFLAVTKKYRYPKPEGSPLTKITQVFVAALRKRKLVPPQNGAALHEEQVVPKGKRLIPHTNQFLFLDKAAIKLDDNNTPWKLSTVTQVEEVKLVIRMLPIWILILGFNTAPSQSSTFFLSQGLRMNNRLGSFKIPPASINVFNNLGVLVSIQIYSSLIVPLVRKWTKNERGITMLQRIGAGMMVAVICLVIAAVVETKRRNATEKLSIFWLLPQYVILGVATGLAHTGIIEFFHDQAPDTFRSLGVSVALLNFGLGFLLCSALISCVKHAAPQWLQNDINKGHLDRFYWLLAALSLVNLAIYVPVAKWYSYKNADDYAETV